MSVANLEHLAGSFEAVIVTAPLDVFLGRPNELAWRGVTLQSHLIHVDGPSDTMTRGYVINHPSQRVPYTRTIETKHATGQQIEATVVSEEYPGSPGRHYPIPTPERRHERTNEKLKQEVQANSPIPVYFCGRLANYQYINQDQAIRQGFDTADRVLAEVTRR
jgi:UDP-galactopyranose mutase